MTDTMESLPQVPACGWERKSTSVCESVSLTESLLFTGHHFLNVYKSFGQYMRKIYLRLVSEVNHFVVLIINLYI